MKKTGVFLLIISLFLSAGPARALSGGGAVGNIYSTDIAASVDGMAIPSYNIGGRTAVCLEDLAYYGFEVSRDDGARTVKATSWMLPGTAPVFTAKRAAPGRIVGKVYATDIKAVVNGFPVPAYDIGGKTAVCLEDLGDMADSPNADYGFSRYYMRCAWDAQARTVSLCVLRSNEKEAYGILNPLKISSQYENGVVRLTQTPFSTSFGGSFAPVENRIIPVETSVNGEMTGESVACLFNYSQLYFDLGKLSALAEALPPLTVTYEMALEHFTTPPYTSFVRVDQRFDTPSCTILLMSTTGFVGNIQSLIKINRDGTYHDLFAQLPGDQNRGITEISLSEEENTLYFTRVRADSGAAEHYKILLPGDAVERID